MSFTSSSPSLFTLADLGWNDRLAAQHTMLESWPDQPPGRVVRHDGASIVAALDGSFGRAHLRPSLPAVTVGDWVTLDGEVVRELIPRTSLLQRRDPSTGLSQPLAANVDVVGIVCGLDRPLSLGRIERFSTLAWDAGATPLVILSKSDLVDTTDELESEIYSGLPGTDVAAVSSVHGDGVADLLTVCREKTLVLVGESGAGKSTPLNLMLGHEAARTGAVREETEKVDTRRHRENSTSLATAAASSTHPEYARSASLPMLKPSTRALATSPNSPLGADSTTATMTPNRVVLCSKHSKEETLPRDASVVGGLFGRRLCPQSYGPTALRTERPLAAWASCIEMHRGSKVSAAERHETSEPRKTDAH